MTSLPSPRVPNIREWWLNTRRSKCWHGLKLARKLWATEDGDQRAAAFAYYLLLSLLPLVILLASAGSLFLDRGRAADAVIDLVNNYTPLTGSQEVSIMEAIRQVLDARGSVSLVATGFLIWSALKFLRALIRTTNRLWRSPTYNWWRLPLKSLALLGITVSAALIGILLPAGARLVQPWLTTYLRVPDGIFVLLLNLIPWLVLFYGFIMIYKIAPSRRTRFREVWIGALGATALIWLGGLLFLAYLENFARFNALYGALGGILAFLLWIYVSSRICVFGVCYCAGQAAANAR